MKYMLDTNTCIFAIRGDRKPNSIYQSVVDKVKQETELIVSSLVLAELMHGVKMSKFEDEDKSALRKFLLKMEIADFDTKAAEEYGKIRADLQKNGKLIGIMDMLIAAHAKASDAVLITNNKKDFERINGLKIEDWKE